MNAAAGLAGSNFHVNDFVNHLYTVSIPTGTYRYYDGLLYFLGLLQTSGNFLIYGGGAALSPTAPPSPVPSTKLHIGVITVTISTGSRGPQGYAQVTVKDNNNATVSRANVSAYGQAKRQIATLAIQVRMACSLPIQILEHRACIPSA